jgi:hypothetical protein
MPAGWRKVWDLNWTELRGSHHIFVHREVAGLRLNLQPDRNGQMKMYQLRQLLDAMETNGLRMDDET